MRKSPGPGGALHLKTQKPVWPVCKETGRMKGEEAARGPIVQALYQARLRTLLFSLRGCFAFWPPSWEWAGGMDQKGTRWKESGVLDSGGDHGGSL